MAGLKDIAERSGIDEVLILRLIETIGDHLERGEPVRFRGLGSFSPVHMKEKVFNTPFTRGEPVVRSAFIAVKFVTSSLLEERLNGANP